ncbi:Exocyst complex component 1 [Kappamyces sp. JEL0680]|nr:Exocyst complex component 1 [Kappamyces sp. JEL0680]
MPQDKELRNQLATQLFKQGSDEKILFSARIIDGISRNGKKEDDDDDEKGKTRIICLTSKKARVKLLKIKAGGNFSSFTITKTWTLEDIKTLENGDNATLHILVGKQYSWVFENLEDRVAFVYTIVKSVGSDEKKMPNFLNFDAEMVQEQMAAIAAQAAQKADQKKNGGMNGSEESFIQDLEDEFNDDDGKADVELPAVDLDLILNDFKWSASGDAAALEASLISELQALEAANVHDIIQSENQANAVVEHIERSLSELSQISNWLTHYTEVLEKMGNDVHQIEAQNKGMQVTTSNQKLLLQELDSFIASLRVPAFVLEVLANEGLDTADGVMECERAVERVMSVIRYKNDDLLDMSAVKERVAFLQGHVNGFSTRLCEFLSQFYLSQAEMYLNDKTRASQRNALRLMGHEATEAKLYKFKKLLMWLKDVDTRKHYDLQMAYVKELSRTYRREIGDFLEILRNLHMSKKMDESDFLFALPTTTVTTAASNVLKSAIGVSEKSSGGMRLDIFKKKPKTARNEASVPEDDDDDRASVVSADEDQQRMGPDEALNHALYKLTSIMVREQNFLMDFFGLVKQAVPVVTTATMTDMPDLEEDGVDNWQRMLAIPRQQFKDPKAEKRINELMENLFEDIRDMLNAVIEAGLKNDQSHSVGMLAHIEFHTKEYHKTCHIYIINLLEALSRKVNVVFEKFVADQVKAIEDTRITVKKRSGILPFIRTFPKFVDRVEKMLSTWDGSARKLVDKAYAKIIKAMFDTLEAEAQQDAVESKGDEKDSLNKQILTVENMHHFHSEIRARKVPSLDPFVKQAKLLYDVNLESYGKSVIRKPLGKLLEFFEGVEGLLKTGPADEVSYHVQYSKTSLRDVIKKYPGKEIRKSLEVLYKRVDKHFTEEEGLLQVVWRSIQEEFVRQLRKYEELITKCYPDITMRLDFTLEELLGFFSDLAQSH